MSRPKQSRPRAASATSTAAGAVASSAGAGEGHNCVTLAGRISGVPQSRELPSGDTVVQLRVVVPRPEARRGRAAAERRSASVDTIDVGVWGKALQRRVLKLVDGADVVVRGALRRRFWRGPGGPVSRYEVEASAIEVVRRG